jgi:lysophospholipase
MEYERFLSSFDGTRLFVRFESDRDDPAAVVVIVHGLCEYHNHYDALARSLREQGLAVYRFDHRGHGRSGGERTFLNDWTELTDDTHVVVSLAMAEHPGKKVFMIGHSMGGFTSALYGTRYPGEIAGVILSGAPVNDSYGAFDAFTGREDPHERIPSDLGEVTEEYLADPWNVTSYTVGVCLTLKRGVAHLREHYGEFVSPVLMLHGEKDILVSPQDGVLGLGRVSSADRQLKIYGGLGHELFNSERQEEVTGDVLAWLLRRI